MSTDFCPPVPSGVPEAVEAALRLEQPSRQWNLTGTEGANHRLIVAEYEGRMAELQGKGEQVRARLREDMRSFGAYLRSRGVNPEHIVLCVHEAMKAIPIARQLFQPGGLGNDIMKWSIEGYYSTAE